MNFSEVTYNILVFLLCTNISFAIACIKWVLPKPTPPYKKSGLYDVAGASATANAAACANLLLFPTTKLSNVYLGFKLEFKVWVYCPTCDIDDSCSSSLSSFNITVISHSLFVKYLKVFLNNS